MLFLYLVLYIVIFLLLASWNASIAIAFAFVTSILFRIYLPTIKGYIGEKRVNQVLRKLGDEYLIYHDLYVEKKDGKTAQVDHVVLSKYGIFVIETKNYKGWIFGNETQKNWTQVIYKKKTRFYNPILQNQTHIRALKAYLNMNVSFYSMIVFSNEATLKFENNFLEAKVIKNNQLLKALRKFNTPQIPQQQLNEIQQKMNTLIISDKKLKLKIKKNHIQQRIYRSRTSRYTPHKELRTTK